MRICFFGGGFSAHGGIERVLSIIIRNLSMKENVDIYCLSLNDSKPLDFYSLPEGLKLDHLFEMPVNMKTALIKGGVGKLVKYLKENQMDIIVACGVIYFPLSVIGGRLAGVKVITWEHSAPSTKDEFLLEGTSRSVGARLSDMNVLISQEAKSYYENHFRKKRNVVIYNPLDNKLFNKEICYKKDSTILISVGRLTYQKNYQLMIDIAENVLAKHDGWSWHIYGDGEQKEELKALIAEKNLTGKLVLMGNVADIYDRYPHYAGIVMTSRWEGFPMVLIEAAANGLPMISFDIATGPKEIIEDSVNGFLIPKEDLDSFVTKLDMLMTDAEMRSKFSAEAAKTVEIFRVENIVEQWSNLFGELKKM